MRVPRFFAHIPFSYKRGEIFQKDLVWQIGKVLRMKRGDELVLADGSGKERKCKIEHVGGDLVRVREISPPEKGTMPSRKVTLCCAVLKKENFEWASQKATEAGVSRIIPVLTERTVKSGIRRDRLEKIVREAAEQSGRSDIPSLSEPISFSEAVSLHDPSRILFDFSGEDILSLQGKVAQECLVLSGPEGGWTAEELDHAREEGWYAAHLGPFALRAESAALVGSWLALHL